MRYLLRLLQSFFAEILCSFIFGFTVYSTVLNTKYELDPAETISICLGICFSSVAIIYVFADHALCHFNPAITLAAMLTLKIDFFNGIGYIISQGVGFILAALMIVVTFPGSYTDNLEKIRVGNLTSDVTNVNLFFSEFTLTAILTFVAFEVGINAHRNPRYSLYGEEPQKDRSIIAPLAIGMTLGFLSLIAVKTSGSTFNPALIFAPMILSNGWSLSWQYYVSQFTGGLLGALIQVWLVFK